MQESLASTASAPPARPTLINYVVVYTTLAVVGIAAVRAVDTSSAVLAPNALVPPLFALLALIGVVWLSMALLRNLMVAVGRASMRYYHRYSDELPAEWIERPARTFNNLMQVPWVFSVVCLVSMTLDRVDSSQVTLAWWFVALRALHALIMLAWNFVPYRFGCYVASTIVLIALSVEVALRCWPSAG